jgi:peptidoglycan/LPS O-acetylase OafA/YrhL
MIFALFAIAIWVGSILAGIAAVGIVGTYAWQCFEDWIDRETKPQPTPEASATLSEPTEVKP